MSGPHVVDDLMWIVNSPPLLRSTWRPAHCLSCEAIDRERLETFLADQQAQRAGRYRVGQYFEDLVHYYLTHHADTHDLRRGLQILDDARTLGELDFVYRDADSRPVHLETAVKFYLRVHDANPIGSHYVGDYIGPNANDTLQKKVRRLREHQLPMSDHPYARQTVFAEAGPLQKNAWVCGRIFYHPDRAEPEPPSALLSAGHLRGDWIRRSELDRLDRAGSRAQFCVLQKPYWLTGNDSTCERYSAGGIATRLRNHFDERGHAVMIGESDARDPARVYRHVMIVSDDWPLQESGRKR